MDENSKLILGLVLIAIPITGAFALNIVIYFIISRISGWHTLARTYAQQAPRGGTPQFAGTWLNGKFGKSRYKNCLRISLFADCMVLALPFIFRAGHPTMQIPRDKITGGEMGKSWLGSQVYDFSIDGVKVEIYGRGAVEIQSWINEIR